MENIQNKENFLENPLVLAYLECVYRIVHSISYPNDKTRINIVLMAEEKARKVFQELSKIDEIHMDQIEYAYNKWKTG